jgi:ATP-dependent Clp protease ATP-binding subunit ClpC
VKITDEAIECAAKMAVRYISDRFLPDKAIDLIDEACSKVRLRSFTMPPEVKEIEEKLKEVTSQELMDCANKYFTDDYVLAILKP